MSTHTEAAETPIPIDPDGPYAGTLSSSMAYVPARVRGALADTGEMSGLLLAALWSAVRHPRGYWGDVVDELRTSITRCTLPVMVALFGFLMTLCIPSVLFVKAAGVTELFGPLLLTVCLRSFTPWITALLLSGAVGAAITADLGARTVREEIDAMSVMGVDPIRSLVVPRIVATAIGTTLMSVPAALSTVLSIKVAASYVGGIPQGDFVQFLWSSMSPVELISMLLNSFLAGLVIGAVCCHRGLAAGGGAVGLGQAVNKAVVQCFVALFALQLGYNSIMLGLFPTLGTFR